MKTLADILNEGVFDIDDHDDLNDISVGKDDIQKLINQKIYDRFWNNGKPTKDGWKFSHDITGLKMNNYGFSKTIIKEDNWSNDKPVYIHIDLYFGVTGTQIRLPKLVGVLTGPNFESVAADETCIKIYIKKVLPDIDIHRKYISGTDALWVEPRNAKELNDIVNLLANMFENFLSKPIQKDISEQIERDLQMEKFTMFAPTLIMKSIIL